MPHDDIYSKKEVQIPPFEFNESVAHVFDDMAVRSIPFYLEVERMTAELSAEFYQNGTYIYDLGCSTGTAMIQIDKELEKRKREPEGIIGIDNSEAMCLEAKTKIAEYANAGNKNGNRFQTLQCDVEDAEFHSASAVIMNYTLQFVSPLKREKLIQKIYNALVPKGVLIVSDKVHQSSTDVSRIFMDKYYDFKRRNGYSDVEIWQKREALENVLIPYTIGEERSLFSKCGFETIDIFFSWYNFTSFLCIKG